MNNVDLSNLTAQQKSDLLAELQKEVKQESLERKAAYEELRSKLVFDVMQRLTPVVNTTTEFKEWLTAETRSFFEVMREYGKLKSSDQKSITIIEDDFKIEMKANSVKGFDERADIAAERLVEYLKAYVSKTEKGTEDPMYQLAMTLLERNKQGDFDYKSISRLYELENRFDAEIMALFKESNIIQRNATNFYFYRKDENGVWRRIEPSFCRL